MTIPIASRSVRFPLLVIGHAALIGILTLTVFTVRGDLPALQARLKNVFPWDALIRENKKTQGDARITTLNYLIPSFDAMIEHLEKGTPLVKRLRGYNGYIDYYEKLTEIFPELSEGHATLGFLYEQEGKREEAIEAYRRACVLKPNFFWANYNLGLLYIKLRRFDDAAAALTQALKSSVEENLRFIFKSHVFKQILLTPGIHYDPTVSLKEGYINAAKFLSLSQHFAHAPGESLPDEFIKSIQLKVF